MKSGTKGQQSRKKRELLREYFLNALTLAMLKERSAMQADGRLPLGKPAGAGKAALQNV
jgi:hypothetical protein